MLMLDRALRYATAGWPVFPLAPGTKVPLVQSAHGKGSSCRGECGLPGHGLYDATTDADTIRRWWGDDGEPGANIGLRAGIRWWVLDVGRKPPRGGGYTGPEMLALLEEQHGALPATLSVRTTSGGEHRFFRLPTDRSIPSRARIKAPDGRTSSLDVRGSGGYVVAEPSVVAGNSYSLLLKAPIAAAPAWLLDVVAPPRPEPKSIPRAVPVDVSATGTRYGGVALANACNTILSAGEGKRHDAIFKAAAALGELVAGRAVGLSAAACEEALLSAALAAGKSHREAYRPVRDGLNKGAENPRVPELRQRQTPPSQHPRPPPELPEEPPPPDDAPVEQENRPELRVDGDRLDAIRRAWCVVLDHNDPPTWYSQNGALADIHDPADAPPSIRRLSPAHVAGHLVRLARTTRANFKGEVSNCDPPDKLVADLHAIPDPRLPVLDAIVRAPVMDASGRLVTAPGFDRPSGLFYMPAASLRGLAYNTRDVALARDLLLDDWLGEFPFESPADRAHALALALLPFCRRAIAGATPLHLVEAATQGTGKSLLASLCLAPYLGAFPEPMPLSEHDDEVRKMITSALVARKQVVFLDNLDGRVDAPALAIALTSTTWEDRVLGASTLVSAPNRATWVATANNLEMSTDLARRSVRCRLNRRVERPWDYVPVRPRVREWTLDNRKPLVEALLTLCAAWTEAGMPRGEATLGSYEDWAATVGGILQHAGVQGFLDNARQGHDLADPLHTEWRVFVLEWWQQHGSAAVTPGQLAKVAEDHGLLNTVLAPAPNDRARASRVGRGLLRHRGRVFAGLAIVTSDGRKGTEYALKVEDAAAVPVRVPPETPRARYWGD